MDDDEESDRDVGDSMNRGEGEDDMDILEEEFFEEEIVDDFSIWDFA